eukprot:COSAG05_NODE_14729_length_389_cov_0.534483_1_plen_23_part_10
MEAPPDLKLLEAGDIEEMELNKL